MTLREEIPMPLNVARLPFEECLPGSDPLPSGQDALRWAAKRFDPVRIKGHRYIKEGCLRACECGHYCGNLDAPSYLNNDQRGDGAYCLEPKTMDSHCRNRHNLHLVAIGPRVVLALDDAA